MSKKPDVKATKKVKDIKKIAEDKTFGVKNKNKSKQLQTIVKTIAGQQKGGLDKMQDDIYKEKKKKQALEEERKLMVDVFANTVPKIIATGEGGEIQICQYFKAGLCQKGKKCKMSHNLAPDPKKVEKMDLYTDQRDIMFGNKDTIDHWDAEKLSEVVDYNDAKYSAPNRTEKPCKFFIDAVEKKTYGWLWVCPNGYNCIFKHALPPGYQLKSSKKENVEVIRGDDDIIEEIDEAREKLLSKKLTALTFETFSKWIGKRKVRKDKERDAKIKEELKIIGVKVKRNVTGRELFEKEKDLFQDAEDAVDEYKREDAIPEEDEDDDRIRNDEDDEEENKNKVEIDADAFADEEVPDL